MEEISVFIVEDDPMVMSIIHHFTEKIVSFKVVGTSNSEIESLKKIKELRPDLILLDIFLPNGSGLSLLKKIRQENISSDVILITAANDTTTVQETLRHGAIDYLIKPFNFERFQQSLQTFLNLKRLLYAQENITQVDLDLFHSPVNTTGLNNILSIPKGVHLVTMKDILNYLYQQHNQLSCKEIASALSMSNVTTWRYLEYLVEKGKVKTTLEHGSKGRPTKYYKIVT